MRLPLLMILAAAWTLLPQPASADPLIFDDLEQFLAATDAYRDSAPYPGRGSSSCLSPGASIVEVCATSTALRYGDFSSALPQSGAAEPELTVVGPQDLDLSFQSPPDRREQVFAFGVEIDDPLGSGSPRLALRLVSGSTRSEEHIIQFRGRFFGLWSDLPFDRIEIRDLSQVLEEAYFGPLYVGHRAPAAPSKRTPTLTGAQEKFGSSVAVSGNVLVGKGAGQAVVMERDADRLRKWSTTAILGDPSSRSWADISDSVAIDGDLVAVGNRSAETVTLFERDHGGLDRWGEVVTLAGQANGFTEFGASVSLAGDTLAVGAPTEDDGVVYVFRRDAGGPGQWGQVARLTSPTPFYFGLSVSISGETLAVGSPQDFDAVLRAGTVHIYERDAGGPENWGETARLRPLDSGPGHEFGYAVSLDGDRLLAVAPGAGPVLPPGTTGHTGRAYIFERGPRAPASAPGAPPGAWVEVAEQPLSNGPQPFYLPEAAAALSGDVAVVGVQYDNANGLDAGAALVFSKDQGGPGAWGLERRITPPDGYPRDQFGFSVATDGEMVMVGAPFDDDREPQSGAVYIFPASLFRDGFELGTASRWSVRKVD